ncbi:MAG: hypothetical protein ACRECX_05265 [Methyloceanibacter sp.]|uniref:hypothetical protein n=1 Tax=Methyloceanibacter sp. TaxID=1965321 RepID=UPI003D6C879A
MSHCRLSLSFARFRAAICAATLALALVALAPPPVYAQEPAEEPAAEPQQEAPAESKPSWDVSKPCENVQHPYEADLCQQWRTAEAAEKTAISTERAVALSRLLMLIGLAATGLLLLLFIPLILAALAARRAARGAGAAHASAPDTADREDEVRAYVDVDKLEFIETPESEGVVKVKVVFRNTGQTPAFKTRSATQIGIRGVADEDLIPVMPLPDRAANSARPRLGRDATTVDIVECDSTPSLADRVMNGDATIVVWGFAEYMDVFARRRRTSFQYLCNAETLDTGQVFKPMVRGDEEG